jgi:Tfp pilus assembly protein PilE
LRTLLVVVAVVSILVAVVAREAQLRLELERERARAEANLQKARAVWDLFYTERAEQLVTPGPRNDELRRETLERAMEFYQGMESRASSPEERASIHNKMEEIDKELSDPEPTREG